MPRIRQNELHARRVRRLKLRKLRQRYAGVKTAAEKEQVLQRVARMTPWLSAEEFLAPLKGR